LVVGFTEGNKLERFGDLFHTECTTTSRSGPLEISGEWNLCFGGGGGVVACAATSSRFRKDGLLASGNSGGGVRCDIGVGEGGGME